MPIGQSIGWDQPVCLYLSLGFKPLRAGSAAIRLSASAFSYISSFSHSGTRLSGTMHTPQRGSRDEVP